MSGSNVSRANSQTGFVADASVSYPTPQGVEFGVRRIDADNFPMDVNAEAKANLPSDLTRSLVGRGTGREIRDELVTLNVCTE